MTPDARLLAEITLAAGFSSFEGGGISYNIPCARHVLLERSIRHWQYCDRLVGRFEEAGVSINREPFGPLTGTLMPPVICLGALVARQVRATKIIVKTPHEACGVPTLAANQAGLKATRQTWPHQ